jgi:hypothetical protein
LYICVVITQVCNEEEHDMPTTTDPEARTAKGPDSHADRPEAEVISYVLHRDREEP